MKTELLFLSVFLSFSTLAEGGHVERTVAEILKNVTLLKTERPDAVPMAFWDFDGTILKGDLTEGLEEDGRETYRGLAHETIAAGLCGVYRGEEGWRMYHDRDYPRLNEIGHWLGWPYNAQIYRGIELKTLQDFCRAKMESFYRGWFFAESVAIWRALAAAGVENYVVSAAPEIFVRCAASSLGVDESRITGIRVEIDGGRVTDRVIHPVPMGEGKVENVRRLVLSRANGIAIAGFGNSYSTDGAFLRYIVSQHLPGGAKGTALMINGGEPRPECRGLFRLAEQRRTVRESDGAAVRDACARPGPAGRGLPVAAGCAY